MRSRALVVLVSALVVGGLVAPTADAGHRFGGHWRTNTTPFNVRFIDSTQSSWRGVMDASAAKWSESDVLNIVIEDGNSNRKMRRRCPRASDAVRICNFRYGNTGWVGLTILAIRGKHIVKGAIKLNSTYLGKKNRKVMCHEMGHGLGLGHRAQSKSCMKQGAASKTPDGHDYKMLRRIYSHSHAAAAAAADHGGDDGKTRIVRIPYPADGF